jgi:hypothetical protein
MAERLQLQKKPGCDKKEKRDPSTIFGETSEYIQNKKS